MKCSFCGGENREGANFCAFCGSPMAKKRSRAAEVFIALGKAACYFLYFFAMQTLVLAAYGTAIGVKLGMSLGMSGEVLDEDKLVETVLNEFYLYANEAMIVSAVLSLLVLAIFFLVRKRKPHKEICLKVISPLPAVYSAALGAAMQIAVSITLALMTPILPQYLFDSLDGQYESLYSGSPVALFINVALLTPILEEVIFRGLIFTRLRRAMPAGAAIALSALVFGLAHGNVIGICYASLLGVMLALAFERYGSVIPGILIHAGFNGVSYILESIMPENGLLIMSVYFVSLAVIVGALYLMLRKKEDAAPVTAGNNSDYEKGITNEAL